MKDCNLNLGNSFNNTTIKDTIIMVETLSKIGLPAFSLLLGAVTSFVVRDEMQMPTYMRIKMSTVEHHILSRR